MWTAALPAESLRVNDDLHLISMSAEDVERIHDWYLLLRNLGAEREVDTELAARLEVWLDRHS